MKRVLIAFMFSVSLQTGWTADPKAPLELPRPLPFTINSLRRAYLSPDGRFVAAPDSYGALSIFDAKTGKPARESLVRALKKEGFLAFTPNGKFVLTGKYREVEPNSNRAISYNVNVWDAQTGKHLRTIPLRDRIGARAVDYAVANHTFVALGDEIAAAYDLKTGKELRTFRAKHAKYLSALSTDGKWLLTTTKDNQVLRWNVLKPGPAQEVYSFKERVESIAISADGRYCAAATWGRRSRVWIFDALKDEHRADTLPALGRCNHGLLFTPNGKTLIGVGGGLNHGLMVWDWQASAQPRGGSYPSIIAYTDALLAPGATRGIQNGGSLTADGRWLLTYYGKQLYLWDLQPPKPPPPPEPPPSIEPPPPPKK